MKRLLELRKLMVGIPAGRRSELGRQFLHTLWDNEKDFLENTCFIQTKEAKVQLLKMNYAQKRFWEDVVLHCRKAAMPIRGVVLKARQLGFCYDPSMRILTAGMEWVSLDDVRVGERIVACDEEIPGGRGRGRKLRSSVIEAKRTVRAEAYRITFKSGHGLVATGPHRHLCRKRGGTDCQWRSVADTRIGDVVRYVCRPWDVDDRDVEQVFEDGWIGGMIDGEGSFRRRPVGGVSLSISQKMGSVYERAKQWAENSGFVFNEQLKLAKEDRNHDVGQVVFHRLGEVFEIVGRTRPQRMLEDDSWWADSDLPGKRTGEAWDEVVEIVPLGMQRMIDLQTSTKTFVCEGFVSHNSTLIQAVHYTWLSMRPNRFAMTISFDDESTEEMFGKAQMMHDHLWFPVPTARRRKQTMSFEAPHHSTFYSRTSGNTSAGRSQTLHFVHASEVPMWPSPDETLLSVQQSIPALLDTSMFIESTAKGAVGCFYDEWNAAEAGENEFIPFFAPWFWDKTYSMEFRSEEDKAQFVRSMSVMDSRCQKRYGLTYEQMHWRSWTIKNKCSGSEKKFRQEYPACAEEAFLATGSPVFDTERVLELARNARKPQWLGDILLQHDSFPFR